MTMDVAFSVNKYLPPDGDIVMCYGHKTCCCVLDMEELAEWHKVKFTFEISEYKLKKDIPKDAEESILEYAKVVEYWKLIAEDYQEHVIGVTKWKYIKDQKES